MNQLVYEATQYLLPCAELFIHSVRVGPFEAIVVAAGDEIITFQDGCPPRLHIVSIVDKATAPYGPIHFDQIVAQALRRLSLPPNTGL